MNSKLPVTIVILALNEEQLIARCLSSTRWAAEVILVDSGSSDATKAIAIQMGAKVVEQPWLGYSAQRNRGAAAAEFDWIFVMDVDEIVSDELEAAIRATFDGPGPSPRDGFAVDRRGDFLGRLLPNSSRRVKRLAFVRFYNRLYSSFDEELLVHEEVIVPGQRHLLKGVLLHWRGYVMEEYVTTFGKYATIEADQLIKTGAKPSAAKCILRPLARAAWQYGVKGGWRAGTPGLIEAGMKAFNELARYATHLESELGPMGGSRPSVLSEAGPIKLPDRALDMKTLVWSGCSQLPKYFFFGRYLPISFAPYLEEKATSARVVPAPLKGIPKLEEPHLYLNQTVVQFALDSNAKSTKVASQMAIKGVKSSWLRIVFKPAKCFLATTIQTSGNGMIGMVAAAMKATFFDFVAESKLWEAQHCEKKIPNPPNSIYPLNRYQTSDNLPLVSAGSLK